MLTVKKGKILLTKNTMDGMGVLRVLWIMASTLGMWPLRADTKTSLWMIMHYKSVTRLQTVALCKCTYMYMYY